MPGIGFYDAPSLEQVKKVVADFVNHDSLTDLFPLVVNYVYQPEFKNRYGGMLRIHIANIEYHLQTDSQRLRTKTSLAEKFIPSLKELLGRRK